MAHTFRHDEALPRRKINYPVVEIDQEPPIEHEKEFIDLFMFMPVVFTLNYRHPDDRIVHLAKCLVVPFVCAGISQFLYINHFKWPVQNVEVSFVRKLVGAWSRIHAANLTAETTEVAEKTRKNFASAISASSVVKEIILHHRNNPFPDP